MNSASTYYRATETRAGWECHHRGGLLDRHTSLHHAARHLFDLSADNAPAQVIAYYLDGTVESVAMID